MDLAAPVPPPGLKSPKIRKSMKWVAVAPFAAILAGIVSYGPPGPPGIGPWV